MFKSGKRDGPGILQTEIDSKFIKYEGTWENDKLHGPCQITFQIKTIMSQWAFGYLLTPIPGLGGDQFLDEQAQSEYRDHINKRLI